MSRRWSLLRTLLLLLLLCTSPALVRADEPAPPAPGAPTADGPSEDEPIEEVEDLPGIVVVPRQALPRQPVPEVVTATRGLLPERFVPRAMTVVDSQRILRRNVPSFLDALDDQIGVWVEKRTAHTSDPVIRGMSGGNILALVDGNTLSTAWGEGGFAGDDLYGKIDPDMIERIEVVRGPSSVLYGSNALGGVINIITKASPFDFTCGCIRTGSRTRLTSASNPAFFRVHEEFYGASRNLRWFLGGTLWRSDDVEDGGGQVQDPTGGHGGFANGRLAWRLHQRALLDVSVQHTNNGQIYRYYRPNQDNKNLRTAAAVALDVDLRAPLADEMRLSLYYQNKRDERRWFDATTGLLTKSGVAKWETLQAGIQLKLEGGCHDFTYGVSLESTEGESPDDEQFTVTPVGGTPSKAAPDSTWSSLGAYVQDRWSPSRYLTLTGAVRLDVLRFETNVDSLYTPAAGLDPSLDEFTDYETALVGGLQANWHMTKCTDVYGGWTRGFRQFAPKFGVSQHGYGVVVPSQLLDPVTADMFEIGVKHRTPWINADVAAYYTRFRNFQNVVRSTFNGSDWFDFNGDAARDTDEDVFVTSGNGRAYVYGVELSADVNLAAINRRWFGDYWSVGGGFAWNFGRDQTNGIPIRHTHPAWGRLQLRYENTDASARPWIELSAQLVNRYTKIPPSRLSGDVGYFEDPQDPTSGKRRLWGLPGYSVLDVRGGFKPAKNMTVVVGVDNVFNKLYRAAHARMDAPGRSVYATIEFEL